MQSVYEAKSGAQTQASPNLLPFSFFLELINYLFLSVLGLCCCTGFLWLWRVGATFLAAVGNLLIMVASHVAEHWF